MKFPMIGKAASIGVVLFALMMALASVTGIVNERESRMRDAENSVADGLSGSQAVIGPVLQRSCEEGWESHEGEGKDRKPVAHKRDFVLRSLPKSLDIKAGAKIAPRSRGIFKVNTYELSSVALAKWPDLSALEPVNEHPGGRVLCDPVQVFVAVGDARGIRTATITVNGQPVDVLPGTGSRTYNRGFHAQIPADAKQLTQPLQIQLQLDLVGTGALSFAPLGDTTTTELTSNWPHPSFGGRFLPTSREVDGKGFKAKWQLSALASSAQQELLEDARLCGFNENLSARPERAEPGRCVETFGLNFMDPVSTYTLSDRATKYGILFIVLTFVGVGLVEILHRLRVHPIQYLLVGCALSVFFLLLVSLSEHMSFAWAYGLASAACSLLLGFYGSFVLRGAKAGFAFGGGIATLYGTLYVLLQREQTALLLGSLLLFVVLSIIMFITRRIDWYALMTQMRGTDDVPPTPGTAT